MVLTCALGFSPHLPVSVCGTVTIQPRARSFSWHLGSPTLAAIALVPRFSLNAGRICLPDGLYARSTGYPSPVSATLMRPSTLKRLIAVQEF